MTGTEPSFTPIFKEGKIEYLGNYGRVSLVLVPWKTVMQILLEAISKHTTDKKVTGNSQHRYAKGHA